MTRGEVNLEDRGLLFSYKGDPRPERGGRPRKYYDLTTNGTRKAMEIKNA